MDDHPFHIAVEDGNIDDVKNLLEQDVDVNILNSYGQSSLHLAVVNSDINMIRLLLKHGVDVRIENKCGNTALNFSVRYPKTDIMKLLLPFDERHFCDMTEYNDYINSRNIWGKTALYNAVDYEQIDHVKLLLDAGADKTIKNNIGHTPIDAARPKEITNLLETHTLEQDIKEPDCL